MGNYRIIEKVPGWTGVYAFNRNAIIKGFQPLLISMHTFFRGFYNENYNTAIPEDSRIKRLTIKGDHNHGYVTSKFQSMKTWPGTTLIFQEHDITNDTAERINAKGINNNVYFIKTREQDSKLLHEMGWKEAIEFISNFYKSIFLSGGKLTAIGKTEKAGCLGFLAYKLAKEGIQFRFIEGLTYQ